MKRPTFRLGTSGGAILTPKLAPTTLTLLITPYRMESSDPLLYPLCDISGSCLLYKEKKEIVDRPYSTVAIRRLLGVEARGSIARIIMLKKWPDIDINTTVVVSCGNRCCVAWDHIQRGVVNPSMKKSKGKV